MPKRTAIIVLGMLRIVEGSAFNSPENSEHSLQSERRSAGNCNFQSKVPKLDRRSFLTIGSLGALSLPLLLQAKELQSKKTSKPAITGKSVIFLFQQGGPSQFETFDPKEDGPTESRSVNGTIPTSVPGLRFGSALPRLAKIAHKLTIVRSFQTQNAGHNIQPIVSSHSFDANMGTHFSRYHGVTDPQTGMPTNAVLFPQTVNSEVTEGRGRGNLAATGPYSKDFRPFTPGKGGKLQSDMTLRLSPDRLDDRRQLLVELDRLERSVDATGNLQSLDKLQKQAYELLLSGGVSSALNLALEDEATLKRYDTRNYMHSSRWNIVNRGRRGYYNGQAATLGHLLLLSRRLCEAGCGFVTVHAGYEGVWDMHADGNNLNMVDGMDAVGYSFDHAVAALIEDIEARGLQDKILLVATGEMGRTPKINKRGGRDHWARLAPLLLYGGGIDGGKVIGRSDSRGGEPGSDAFNQKHLISTILNTLVNLSELRLDPQAPPQLTQLLSHDPIQGVL